ncbi:ClpXP protease specificity-enhancing factor [Leucothrix mucor]|uniref:ClpXP protease specificity-enhancing factor n=1 Tax=Leucothrix mucor TaxID=45248 RepID=UPI0003B38916|nr:ClpXP protease specificity-enhancing factor [Leucothrix mucor]
MMTSNRPYLMRAIFEWIIDNGLTPHVLIDAEVPEVQVPRQYVDEGRIILNISPSAVQNFSIDNQWLSFNARFGGKPFEIFAPIHAIRAVYAAENSEGMMFEPMPESEVEPPTEPDPDPEPPKPSSRPSLRVVK